MSYNGIKEVERYFESKFEAFADDYISEGYVINKYSCEYRLAKALFIGEAFEEIALTMTNDPRRQDETSLYYIFDIVEDFSDTMMDDMIRDRLNELIGE